MKKYIYLWVLLMMLSVKLFAQGQYNNWFWSLGQRITFNTNPPTVIPTPSSIAFFGNTSASISSPAGILLFYTDGHLVKDAAHNTMPNGILFSGSNWVTAAFGKQSALIVPDPGDSNRYYLFVVKPNSGIFELYYSIVDMTLNGGMGDVVSTSKNVLLASSVDGEITATRQTATNNFWILIHSHFNNVFNAYLLTASGISSTPVTSAIGPVNTQAPYCSMGCMKINPQGTKVARIYPKVNTACLLQDTIQLYDFSASTGVFSNYQFLTGLSNEWHNCGGGANNTWYYYLLGLEFSPNGNLLYRTRIIYNSDTLIQYDLSNNNNKTFIPIPATTPDHCINDMQLAPNGKIYLVSDVPNNNTISTMSVIDQPDVPGLGCNYIYAAQSLASNLLCNTCLFPNIVPSLLGNFSNFSPIVDSQYANNILYTTATLHARVSSDGNSPITQRGFYYATSPIPLSNQIFVPGTTGFYAANLTGLTPNTLYYYRAFASNANGTTIYFDSTFHTLPLPNTAPLIKNLHNKATCVSDTMRFVVVDAQTTPANTSVTFTSSNTSLLPLSSITIAGADTNKVLSFTPTPYQSGTSLVTITATDSNGASTSQSFSIIVAPGAPISINALNSIIACLGDSVLLQCAIPQGTTINWYVNATPSGNGNPQFATTQSASVYAVCTNAQGCATISNTINATVKPVPQVQCSVNGPATICVGDSVQVQALSTAGYSYQWFKNTQLLPNATNAIYYAKQSGDYSYVATLNGCSKTSNAQTVQVVPAPIASISTPNTTVICNGQGALLQATTGAGYTYQWTMNGFNIAGATNPTYTATIGSYYTVKVSNGYCSRTSTPITITVNTAPVAIIHWNGTQLFSPISFYSYQWYFNGVLIPGATGQYYTPTQAGLYYVMVGNENGCKSLSPNYNLLTLSINTIATPSLSIYPNPTTGMLQVAEFKEGMLYVYNAMGQLIIKQTEPLIDLSKQANGIYQIRAYNQAQELIGIGRAVKE